MFNLTTYTSGAPNVNPDFLQVQSLSTIVVVDGLFSICKSYYNLSDFYKSLAEKIIKSFFYQQFFSRCV